jgi:hypothetical protein
MRKLSLFLPALHSSSTINVHQRRLAGAARTAQLENCARLE